MSHKNREICKKPPEKELPNVEFCLNCTYFLGRVGTGRVDSKFSSLNLVVEGGGKEGRLKPSSIATFARSRAAARR
jgi:hypothetical protein